MIIIAVLNQFGVIFENHEKRNLKFMNIYERVHSSARVH